MQGGWCIYVLLWDNGIICVCVCICSSDLRLRTGDIFEEFIRWWGFAGFEYNGDFTGL